MNKILRQGISLSSNDNCPTWLQANEFDLFPFRAQQSLSQLVNVQQFAQIMSVLFYHY